MVTGGITLHLRKKTKGFLLIKKAVNDKSFLSRSSPRGYNTLCLLQGRISRFLNLVANISDLIKRNFLKL